MTDTDAAAPPVGQTDRMPSPDFGPFRTALRSEGTKVAGYLMLLGLPRDDAADLHLVIDRIAVALDDPEAPRWVAALLAEMNWRPHLVAAIAYLLDGPSRLPSDSLWSAIDAGSWVVPQLVVTAFFTDRDFASRAALRLDRCCPISPLGAYERLSPAEQHTVGHAPSGKLAASLLALAAEVPELRAREGVWRAEPEIRALLDRDASWDSSEEITAGWSARIRACFSQRGVVLARPG